MRVRASKLKPVVITGDMREVLARMPAHSVDAVVTDPPYGLSFMSKHWDQQVPGPDYWREVLRVCKPGAHVLAFGGTRTAHRLACAVEDAGFTIRDCVSWNHGSGFPKSHDVSKAIDREAGAMRNVVGKHPRPSGNAPGCGWGHVDRKDTYRDTYDKSVSVITAPATDAARQWNGFGTSLKPAWEPVYLARKPFEGTVARNVCEHGCGALNIAGCRIATSPADAKAMERCNTQGSARLNRSEGFLSASTGASALDTTLGRWPANLVLDETAARLLDAQTGELTSGGGVRRVNKSAPTAFNPIGAHSRVYDADSGGASRFFYTAKASRSEREAGLDAAEGTRANGHPTVKPIALMRWLCRLITPPGGVILDPFAGSGSTGCAAVLEGFRFIGIELDSKYADIAKARIAHHELSPRGDNFERGKVRCRAAS
jgi:site-specific DNA-methyltransferase (adenine-specific)